jgi:hypothetical protein
MLRQRIQLLTQLAEDLALFQRNLHLHRVQHLQLEVGLDSHVQVTHSLDGAVTAVQLLGSVYQ